MTIEEYKELEVLLSGLQVVGLTKSTEKRLEKSLQVIQRDKQLLIHNVVSSKITVLITYEEIDVALGCFSKSKQTRVVEIDNLQELNKLGDKLIDVKIIS